MGLLLSGGGAQVTENAEKAELPDTFFASAFTGKTSPQECHAPRDQGKGTLEENFPLVREDWLGEQLGKLHIYRSMDSDGMHP